MNENWDERTEVLLLLSPFATRATLTEGSRQSGFEVA